MHRPAIVTSTLLAVLVTAPVAAESHRTARLDGPDLLEAARQVPIGGSLRVEGVQLRGSKSLTYFDLERFEVFTRDARIEVHGDAGVSRLPVPKNAYFRGSIAGESRSSAFLTVLETGEMRGIAASGGEYWVMAAEADRPNAPVGLAIRQIDAVTELARQIHQFSCATDHLSTFENDLAPSEPVQPADARPAPHKMTASYTARVAVETDYEFFQRLGGQTQAIDYIGDLFAYMSGIYSGEVDTTLLISHLSLWSTSADPWTQTSTLCALYEFGDYWNDNHAAVERSTAHFLSGKSLGGGIAWLGVLCQGAFNVSGADCPGLSPNGNYGGAYGVTANIDGDFDINNPTPVWDVVAVSHEIGHNFDSPHTHCYGGVGGNAEPVDQCSSVECEEDCYCGSPSLPCGQTSAGCGTIMSYCHLLSGGMSNIALTLGEGHPYGVSPERVPSRMRDHVMSQASIDPSCLTFESQENIHDDDFESGTLGKWSQ